MRQPLCGFSDLGAQTRGWTMRARAEEHHGEQSCAINCCRRRGGRHTCVVRRRRRWLVGCKVWSFLRMEEGERHLKNFEAAPFALSPAPAPSSPQPSTRHRDLPPLRLYSLHEGNGPEDMRTGMKISSLRSGILSMLPLKLWGSCACVHGLEKELHPARHPCEQDALRCLPVWGLQSADNANFRGIECIFIPKGSPSPPPLLLLHYSLGSMGRNLGGRAADGAGEEAGRLAG